MENKDQKGSVRQPKSELFESLSRNLYGEYLPKQKWEAVEPEIYGEEKLCDECKRKLDREHAARDNEKTSILIHSQA